MSVPGPRGASRGTRPPAQRRGRVRRQALLEAAVALLREGGFVAVTHRAVAHRAGLPLAATTYYFASREELLAEAFELLVAAELAGLGAAARGADPLGALLATCADDRAGQIGLWELYLQAGRDPALQRVARAWTDGVGEIVADALRAAGHSLGPADTRLVAVLLTGFWLEHLVEARPGAAEEGRALLERTLQTTRRRAGTPPDAPPGRPAGEPGESRRSGESG
ncbi:hypothetical protein GCM10010517_73250 [Streptosporangium fragile]|uniref:HTH tetR-type domain-containing protein n=1 Tax=Streptosporangium fragile TaxID=46186 RepID=A0ABP6IRQ2_9ACTN